MKIERTKIEKLLVFIAWAGLVGGLLVGTWWTVTTIINNEEMAFPKAVFSFFSSYAVSITCWALILELVAIADRQREILNQLKK